MGLLDLLGTGAALQPRQPRLRLQHPGLRHRQRLLQRLRIEFRQQFPGGHRITFLKVHGPQPAAHPKAQLHLTNIDIAVQRQPRSRSRRKPRRQPSIAAPRSKGDQDQGDDDSSTHEMASTNTGKGYHAGGPA